MALDKVLIRRPVLFLAAVWAVVMLAVWPVGEFAVNDDWGFSTSVYWWRENGALEFTHWFAMTLVTQIALALAWTEAFGYSQTALRLMVALLAGGAVVAGYAVARSCGNGRAMALAIAGLLIAYPPFLGVSFSFMTDASFLFFSALALYAFARVILGKGEVRGFFLLGVVAYVAAMLLRQPAVVIGVAFVVGDLAARNFDWRSLLRTAPVALGGVLLIASYPAWIGLLTELPPEYFLRTEQMKQIFADILSFKLGALAPAAFATVKGGLYLGLFAAPVALPVAGWRLRSGGYRLRHSACLVAAAALLAFAALAMGFYIPDVGNILTRDGMGPRLIEPFPPQSDFSWIWALLNAAAMLSVGVLAAEVVKGAEDYARALKQGERDAGRDGVRLFILAAAALAYIPYGLHYKAWFDRYILFSAVAALAVLSGFCGWARAPRQTMTAIVSLLAVGGAAGVVLERDFMQWSRTRAALAADAIARFDLAPEMIDGGFEFNNLNALLASKPGTRPTAAVADADERPYRIAKRPLDGYVVIGQAPAGQILPLGGDVLYLLRKEACAERAGC